MKKFIFLALFGLSLCVKSYAQEKFETYESAYFEKEFLIQLSYDVDGGEYDTTEGFHASYDLWIDVKSLDYTYDESAGITVSSKDYSEFKEALLNAKQKYEEWKYAADSSNIKEMSKTMKISSSVDGFFLAGRDWQFDYTVKLQFDFKIAAGKTLLIIRTGEMASNSNQFITCADAVIVFSSAEEIQEFIDKISSQKIDKFISDSVSNKKAKEELFKD